MGLRVLGCLALMLEAQVLNEVQEVMSIEWRSIVTATNRGIPSNENMRSSFGIIAWYLFTSADGSPEVCGHFLTGFTRQW